ncbi:ABC transporter permease [Paenibacillus daejeonensis]|uniref:ABC transporter permease n=1 Tax=Paenibacillus daejeonensis TaxID=135193 RepID=UPI000379B7A9|nr:iron ABC transporter permease [Paenibacillus daejeonensis]
MQIHRTYRTLRNYTNGWVIASLIGAAAILLPILYVMSGLFRPVNENWATVKTYLLTDYVIGSAKLVLLTGFFSTLAGVFLAWLVVGYAFPLRRFFRWGLVLPLAVPPYIAAYTYGTMTSYTGIIQATLRNQFNIQLPHGMMELSSLRGAVFTLSVFLFPYVFLLMRTYLERQSGSYIENGRLLGRSGWGLFTRVVLPLSRPAIIAGAMLVIFEVLSDYGVASYFGVQTISTAIFQTWFGMYDIDSAMRLAAWLLVIIIGIFILERLLRQGRRYGAMSSRSKPLQPVQLKGWAAAGATGLCILVFSAGFLVPVGQILLWATWTYSSVWRSDFVDLLRNTLTGAAWATLVVMGIAVLSAKSVRMVSNAGAYALARLMTAGYAIPGAIIAIGALAVFIGLDELLSPLYVWLLDREEGALVLSLSLPMLLAGYVIRFMATGYNAIEAGYDKIPRTYTEAAQSLGHKQGSTFRRVELPLLKPAILSGFALTFIEIVKELPLTLLLRPFNFDTLATRTYQYAIDERIYEAALPSLLLIMLSLISVIIVLRLEKGRIR